MMDEYDPRELAKRHYRENLWLRETLERSIDDATAHPGEQCEWPDRIDLGAEGPAGRR